MSARLMRTGAAPMTGPLKIADGSVGSPGLAFNTDTTSGIYKTANGLGVSVGGVKVAEFTSSGLSRMIGELIPWTRLSAPSGWVLPYGQTLSRTTYADLWAIAQTEIAGGNTFSTTVTAQPRSVLPTYVGASSQAKTIWAAWWLAVLVLAQGLVGRTVKTRQF